MRCGLLGRKLGHSYSPQIHGKLAGYDYALFEKEPEELGDFLQNGNWNGLNVTIPYKKTVAPYCAELSEVARRLGSVNTLVRREDGTIYGDNTDYAGFRYMVEKGGVDVRGKKCIVLGSGGAAVTVCAVLRDMGAAEVTVISRTGADNYDNLERHADAQIVVNTTPVGMYPNNGAAALDLRRLENCEGVLDIVYNPARTALLLQAEALGIRGVGGLSMLVAQAKRSAEIFTGSKIAQERLEAVETEIRRSLENIVLIGMPGCGKSTVARELGKALGREVIECDAEVEKEAGMPISKIFEAEGEEGFRKRETAVLERFGKQSGLILSTGGGCVTREENYALLHQNGTILWLVRELDRLPSEGRPLSQKESMEAMFARREGQYRRFADGIVENNGTVAETVRAIREELG